MTAAQELMLAQRMGALPKTDSRRGQGWFSYENKNGFYCWTSVNPFQGVYWRSAKLICGRWADHQTHKTLEEALRRET